MLRIAVLVSGGGTNLQALLDAQDAGKIKNGRIVQVIASNPNAYALERAAQHQIPTSVVQPLRILPLLMMPYYRKWRSVKRI